MPTVAIVENLAYMRCSSGEEVYPFGKPGLLSAELETRLPSCRAPTLTLPISQAVTEGNNEVPPPLRPALPPPLVTTLPLASPHSTGFRSHRP